MRNVWPTIVVATLDLVVVAMQRLLLLLASLHELGSCQLDLVVKCPNADVCFLTCFA